MKKNKKNPIFKWVKIDNIKVAIDSQCLSAIESIIKQYDGAIV